MATTESNNPRDPGKRAGMSEEAMQDLLGIKAAISRAQAVIEFELDGTIITANDNFLNALGYTLDEIKGKHHRMFCAAEFAASAEYRDFWDRLGRGEYDAGEYRRITKDGSDIWIQASYNPIFDTSGKPYKVVKFATDITDQKNQARMNAAYKGALDGVTANVMVANADLDIIYMNDTAAELMRDSEADFRKDLPQFDAKSLIGTNIDVFHRNPAHQRGILDALDKPITSQLSLGGRTMKIIASPMTDTEGNRLGTVVEWVDLTEQLQRESEDRARAEQEAKVAAENARIRQALDNVSSNVMVADGDLNIIYLNNTVKEMMTNAQADIRKELPQFNVQSLIGTNIDLFHKNPVHQRTMLANLSATFTSELKLGGRTFRIIANPVNDEDGARIGTVVEWADRTQEVAVETEVEGMVQGVIDGNLKERISLEGKTGFFESLSAGINRLVDNIAEMVSQVKAASNEVSRGADEISQGNANLSQRTEQQASSLEETASSMEEMTSTVKQNADNSGQANQLAVAARDQAEKGGTVVAKAVDAMAEINDSSKKIADIISVIDEIAFQTNLLALNAAVEAARAGEQGRGFAVVASEVRNLAGRSAKAAKEIKDLIHDSVKKVSEGSDLVTESGATLEQIVTAVKKVSDIIAEIAAASQEQSSGIEQVNKAVMQLDELTQQNAALVEQASAASQSMANQARSLDQMMARYVVDEELVARVQAGMNASAASQSQPSAPAERRGPSRPWSSQSESAAGSGQAARPSGPMAATGTEDIDWQEF